MDEEMKKKALEVISWSKDIKSHILNYNLHRRGPFLSNDEKGIKWHQYLLELYASRLKILGYNVYNPEFFDDSIFEDSSAPGLKIKKLKQEKLFSIIEDPYDLENDLKNSQEIKILVQNNQFANELYAALCNVDWYKNNILWTCSWRYAGGIVAELRGIGEYIDFYCNGNEGHVSYQVEESLAKLGWEYKSEEY